MKYLILLFLLTGCYSLTQDRKEYLTNKATQLCSKHGGLDKIVYFRGYVWEDPIWYAAAFCKDDTGRKIK